MRWLRRITAPLRELLLQGTSADKIALCIACGVTLAVFPVIGATTLLCAGAAVILRLNLPAIQAVNYLSSPLQLALLLPLIRVGEFLFDATPLPLSLSEILAMIRNDAGHAISTLWTSGLHAMVAWLLLAPFLFATLYLVSRLILARLPSARFRADSQAVRGDNP